MSRFESSTFIRNAQTMNKDVLLSACEFLGWKCEVEGEDVFVKDLGISQDFFGEYAIKVSGNTVSYNTYYLGNTSEFVELLKQKYNELNVEYSKEAVINAFRSKGFTYKSCDGFIPNKDEAFKFIMVGRSKDKTEEEPVGQIKFTILYDGTVVSDSNYLPFDVNERAHAAMDLIDENFQSKRVMIKKDIPLKYRSKISQQKSIKQNLRNG